MRTKAFISLRKFLALVLIFNGLSASAVFGQSAFDQGVSQKEAEIFPFESTEPVVSEKTSPASIDYTEDLYEVTDNGIFDADGNLVEVARSDESSDQLIIDENSYETLNKILKDNPTSNENSFEAYKESIISNWGGKIQFTQKRLSEIKQNLEAEMENFNSLDEKIVTIEYKLAPIRDEINSLTSQVILLNQQLSLSKEKIKNTEAQIADKEIALREMMRDIQKSGIKLEVQRDMVLDYIYLVYNEEDEFLSYFDEGSDTFKLLLADNSVTENLLGRDYSQVLEETGRKIFYELHDQKTQFEEKQLKLLEEKTKLDYLRVSLNQEKKLLEEGKLAKKQLLEETRGQESAYQELLNESLQQQLDSALAIQNMKDNIDYINQKLDLLDQSFESVSNPNDQIVEDGTVLDEESTDLTFQQEPSEDMARIPAVQPFIWPVPPVAITAYFHDASYPRQWGVHQAVDIRAKQFTEVRAPANGYVFQAKDNGMGYSYIILAHKNKLVTVYGHISKILVKPGTVVKQGEVIGLSGGTPGTAGAGWQTTGPHLHFEVWHEGLQVDPLDWLPVYELPIEYIPDRYLTSD